MTNHDSLKDIRDLAFVLSGFCRNSRDCTKRCPLHDDCPNDHQTTGVGCASQDDWIAWLKREYVGKPNDKP